MSRLDDTLRRIAPLDRALEATARAHLDNLTKPPGSLGRLEDLAARYCVVTGSADPRVGRKRIVTFAGDHGVAAEGVSAYPAEVTPQMVRNMLAGGAAVNVLARHVGADVQVVDIGVNDPLEGAEGLVAAKVRPGAGNIAQGPAMTEAEAVRAIEVGVELAEAAHDDGVTLIGTGEMGIANTTASAALAAALLPSAPEETTGRGTGLDDARLAHKIAVVRRALEVNAGRLGDPLSALAALGGLEIAGICGLILGGAACRMAVVVDGFISSAGALVACRMREPVAEHLFFSHASAEAGHALLLDGLGVEPILDLGMRLGEGTGAALAMSVIEGAVKVYNEMATFGSAGVSGQA
ncbi:MAG: nicotinate-nucleotide--dimethylbenzimidazole phosphoribosyltransferase [Armatimonadetes bacterium]|nr:nicotinate-nucleotide--dimethylbenzimidazole phosphoribosyltransferase [Armatimonadota bacterium]